jgi:hypothetical protein
VAAGERKSRVRISLDRRELASGRESPLFETRSGIVSTADAISNMLPVRFWSQDEHSRMIDWLGNRVPFEHAHRLKYFEFEGVEDLNEADRAAGERRIEENPDFIALYGNSPVTGYAFAAVTCRGYASSGNSSGFRQGLSGFV